MTRTTTWNNIGTPISKAKNVEEAEYDLVQSLLAAANYENDPDLVTTIDLCRNGKFLFSADSEWEAREELEAYEESAA